jgi:hypothetical protein
MKRRTGAAACRWGRGWRRRGRRSVERRSPATARAKLSALAPRGRILRLRGRRRALGPLTRPWNPSGDAKRHWTGAARDRHECRDTFPRAHFFSAPQLPFRPSMDFFLRPRGFRARLYLRRGRCRGVRKSGGQIGLCLVA